ncbi:MAG: amino acid ABC transporter substrate-binding protein [Kiloniellales bacterium]
MRNAVIAILLVFSFSSHAVSAAVLERITESGVITVGYREDAAPYAYKNDIGEPAGYSVDLCRAVVAHIKRQLKLAEIKISYHPVTGENRFEAVQEGRIDLLCGATTATLSRREIVDFSIPIFIDGASVLFRVDGPQDFESLAGHTIGVLSGTTTQDALRVTLQQLGVRADVVTAETHEDGLRQLEEGRLSAYFADQAILLYLMLKSRDAAALRVSKRLFTREPYALALPKDDGRFRLAVDRALSRIYRSGEIEKIYRGSFGDAQPGDLVLALYAVSALPE